MTAKKAGKKAPAEKPRPVRTKDDRDGEDATLSGVNPPPADGGKSRGGHHKPPVGSVL